MAKAIDLTGQMYGDWRVLGRDTGRYWRCLCTLCNETVKSIHASSLRQGTSTSCGCQHKNNKLKEDLTGKQFNNWIVLEYAGDGHWKCECQCKDKTVKLIPRAHLIDGKSKSCGCLRRELAKNTLLDRYGETVSTKVCDPREYWQIETLENKELLTKYILDTFGCYKPTFKQLADRLKVSRHRISVKIHEYMMESLVAIDPLQSNEELELIAFVKEICNGEVITSDRTIINPFELDIYIPEKKLAIEFNGTYWHSSEKIDKLYHQNKTLACAKKGIQLIHIFEYEWKDNEKKEKIKQYLVNHLSNDLIRLYARNVSVIEITNSDYIQFYKKYHLQSSINSEINLALCYDNEIIGMMSFSKPRFNSNFQYELTRLCFNDKYIVIGGAEKLFKHFLNKYNPESIVAYCDISKFTGNVYTRLGFKTSNDCITEPNYVWVDKDKNSVLTRYQTQKHLLVKHGLGSKEQTEDEIMLELGFYKIYDSGNLRLAWYKDN